MQLKLVALGSVPKKLLRAIERQVRASFGIEVEMEKGELPSIAYNRARNQYLASAVLKHLESHGEVVLGVCVRDLYAEGLNFVFGQAQLNGKAAIISVARLKTLEQVRKEAVHELGHVFGLIHCRHRCVMQFSPSLQAVDAKPLKFCKRCKIKLSVLSKIRKDGAKLGRGVGRG